MKSYLKTLALAAALISCAEVSAQMPDFFGSIGGKSDDDSKERSPSYVSADAMDLDMANNMATLLGNVKVENDDMTLECDKMIIYLQDKVKEEQSSNNESAEKPKKDPGDSGKQVQKIECFTNVVITRKFKNEDEDAPPKEQRATAGKAVYDLVERTITLFEKPVVYNEDRWTRADRMILFPDTDKVLMFGKVMTGTGPLR